jgi:hypothetical protein
MSRRYHHSEGQLVGEEPADVYTETLAAPHAYSEPILG